MKVIGIDPGYHRCGFGIVEQGTDGEQLAGSGCLTTSAGDTMAQRLHCLALDLDHVLAEWHPDALAIEEIFFSRNVKTAIGVAQARGVILERAAAGGIAVHEYTPTTVKSQLTGNGRADKSQVEFMVRKLFGSQLGDKRLDDELDAIAVAVCHLQLARSRLSGLGRRN